MALLAVVGLGCGLGEDGGNFEQSKRGVAELVDSTYAATLSRLSPKPFRENPVPCRSAGGGGPATGDYAPTGALEFSIGKKDDPEELVAAVRRYWEEQGYQVQQVPGPAVLAATSDDYRLSFDVTVKVGRALLGATGPCAEPASEAERDRPPEFRSLPG